MMVNITDLPLEILQEIFEYFVDDVDDGFMNSYDDMDIEDIVAIRAVSRTCRAFHYAAAPIFWRSVSFDARWPPDTPSRHGDQLKAKHLLRLLRLWHGRPEVAAHVQNIHVYWSGIYQDPEHISRDNREFLENIGREVGLEVTHCQTEVPTPHLVSLAILLAKKVRHIQIYIPSAQESREALEEIPAPEDTPVRLESLENLWVSFLYDTSPRRPMPLKLVAPLTKLAPNLRKFTASTAHPNVGDIKWSSLTSITLSACLLTASQLAKIINSCHGLREFYLKSDSMPRLAPKEVVTALEGQAGTLRSLELEFGKSWNALPQPESAYNIPSLAGLTGLEMLSLGEHERLGSGNACILRTLPKSLTRLEVPCELGSRAGFEAFANLIRMGHYPKLKLVELPVWSCTVHVGNWRQTCPGKFVFIDYDVGCVPVKEAAKYRHDGGDEDHSSDESDEDGSSDDDDDCDRGRTVWAVRQLLIDAGSDCWIYSSRVTD